MEISNQEIIGKIGESKAISTLTEMGFKICRADEINTVGQSLMSNTTLSEFDCPNLYLLSYLCSQYFHCHVTAQPCLNSSPHFFSFNLKGGTPASLGNYRNMENKGFRYDCANKMSNVAILNKCGDKCKIKVCPIKSYLTIDHYISIFPGLNRMLSTEDGIKGLNRQIEDFEQTMGRESEAKKCYNYLDTNHDIVDFFGYLGSKKKYDKHLRSHPGRIDLFGYKDEKYYCLEVKTNSSQLSPWQVIRLNWMKEQGFASAIIRINLKYPNKEQLFELYKSSTMEELIGILKPALSIEEFELSDYPIFHDIIPSTADVKFYNCRWLSLELDIKAIYDKRRNQDA